MRSTNRKLLASAGFVDIVEVDVTAAYAETVAGWLAGWSSREAAVREVLGDADYDRRFANRENTLAAINAGVLKRSLLTARRPERRRRR